MSICELNFKTQIFKLHLLWCPRRQFTGILNGEQCTKQIFIPPASMHMRGWRKLIDGIAKEWGRGM